MSNKGDGGIYFQSTQSTPSATPQVSGNRLAFLGDRKFEYDAYGNLIKEQRGKGGQLHTEFTYNTSNQLIKITKSNGHKQEDYSYQYDALGRRINKTTPEQSIDFMWNGDVLLSETASGQSSKLYLYEPNSFKPLAVVQEKEIYHYHLDHLGTPQEITRHNGELAWSVQYKAYGNVVRKEVEAIENNLRFQGQYYDAETNLHYNRHRYYDPTTARFISLDPIGLLGGNNNYEYAKSPIAWVDPLGLAAKPGDCQKPEASDVAKSTDIKVLGRLEDTKVARDWKGHDVLNIKDWTIKKNDQWMEQGIKNKQDFYTASPTKGNLWDKAANRETVFSRELNQIKDAGYIKKGDTYVHP